MILKRSSTTVAMNWLRKMDLCLMKEGVKSRLFLAFSGDYTDGVEVT